MSKISALINRDGLIAVSGSKDPDVQLYNGIIKGDTVIIKKSLDEGADPAALRFEGKNTVLHLAVMQKDSVCSTGSDYNLLDILQILLDNGGADIINVTNIRGETALFLACWPIDIREIDSTNEKAIKLLIKHKAKVNTEDLIGGDTPLLGAMFFENSTVVKLLMSEEADASKFNVAQTISLKDLLGDEGLEEEAPADEMKEEKNFDPDTGSNPMESLHISDEEINLAGNNDIIDEQL